ncbi:LuxR family two component transcriptional regulator [Nocardiopsis sp. Huas11]|uniref:response regulator n=1 Tax=Nocardiopsis sp. Huas11 TaxID=2183912 RepID=UPI000EAF3B16|nr:response regulator transcription factor [Nocardiopsis sp. Huas11]RKS08472.1 LuxR family two component transcriptional regulator [Nocardiopsis sp. Huas11]
MTIRVLVVDDQESIRSAFRMVLEAQPDMSVVGEAAEGAGALRQVRVLRPDVVLVDIRMPGMDGLELTRRLAGPEVADPVRVVVVTTFDLDGYVHAALRGGACGFLLKRSGPTLLVEAVRAAVAGESLISPQITVRLLRHLREPAVSPSVEVLTEREIDVVRLVARGLSNAEIAAELFISAGTAKNHLANAQQKLNVRNRVGVAGWAWSSGLAGAGE